MIECSRCFNIRKRLHTPRRQRCEPFVIAHFVYNNNESSAQHARQQWEPFGGTFYHSTFCLQ